MTRSTSILVGCHVLLQVLVWWWIQEVATGLHFAHLSKSVHVKIGSRVLLLCDSDPENATKYWFLNDKPVNSGSRNIFLSDLNTSLTIQAFVSSREDPDNSNDGDYACVIGDDTGVIMSQPISVTEARISSFGDKAGVVMVKAIKGNVAVIPCLPPRSNPPAITIFELNGKTIDSNTDHYLLLPSGNLQIASVQASDAGVYKCVAINPVSLKKRSSKLLTELKIVEQTVDVAVKVVSPPSTQTSVEKGQNFTLECVMEGWPVPTITWEKYGGRLPEEKYTQTLGNLIIRNAHWNDQGTYICRGENGVGNIPRPPVASVDIYEMPYATISPSNITTKIGEKVQFECKTYGKPKPTLTHWLFNGQLFSENSEFLTDANKIFITSVQKRHAGFFQCFVQNKYGAMQAHGQLIVSNVSVPVSSTDTISSSPVSIDTTVAKDHDRSDNCNSDKRKRRKKCKQKEKEKPAWQGDAIMIPPTRPDVRQIDTRSVVVHWDVPQNDGLRVILFRVQYQELGRDGERPYPRNKAWRTVDEDIPPHQFSWEITRLKPAHIYRFRIAAVYENNDNKHSKNSKNIVIEREPRKNRHGGRKDKDITHAPITPQITHTEALNETTLQVKWDFVNSKRAAAEGFLVHYRPVVSAGPYMLKSVKSGLDRQVLLTNLLPKTTYEIKMQAYNSVGDSSFSQLFERRTKAKEVPQLPNEAPPEESSSPSSDLLFIILGSVLGCLVVVLVLFMIMCYWKQRQQNKIIREMNAAIRNKYRDPALQNYMDYTYNRKHAAQLGNGNALGNPDYAFSDVVDEETVVQLPSNELPLTNSGDEADESGNSDDEPYDPTDERYLKQELYRNHLSENDNDC